MYNFRNIFVKILKNAVFIAVALLEQKTLKTRINKYNIKNVLRILFALEITLIITKIQTSQYVKRKSNP